LFLISSVKTALYENIFSYPRNVSHYLWLYKTSEFLHCNRTLSDEMENKFHLYQNLSQLNLTVTPMRNVGYALDTLEKRYWLAGGTLLGRKRKKRILVIIEIKFLIFERLVSSLWFNSIYTRCRFWFICGRL
jgi:hypothetical protein